MNRRGGLYPSAALALMVVAVAPAGAQQPEADEPDPSLAVAQPVVALGGQPAGGAQPGGAGQPGTMEAEEDEEVYNYRLYRLQRIRLEFHPVAPAVPKGDFRLTKLTPMQPAGFRASDINHYLSPVYGLGDGFQIAAGLTGLDRVGPDDEALFGGFGIQKQLIGETPGRPAVSIGGYGMWGHDEHQSGTLYLTGTKSIWQNRDRGMGAVLTAGVKGELFDIGDPHGRARRFDTDGTGVRPFVGMNIALSRRVVVSGEFSPEQPWQKDDMFALRGTYLFRIKGHTVGVTGGIRNTGYLTDTFVGVTL
jgi:hypothetical protein